MWPKPLVAIGAFVIASVVALVALQDAPLDEPCPTGVRSVPALEAHLDPTVVRHQNWVGLAPTDLAGGDTWIYACTNGLIIGRRKVNQVEFDPSTGEAEVKVATRWVDLEWLSGELDAYRDPGRWRLVYTPTDNS
jgi:hypothetical protein